MAQFVSEDSMQRRCGVARPNENLDPTLRWIGQRSDAFARASKLDDPIRKACSPVKGNTIERLLTEGHRRFGGRRRNGARRCELDGRRRRHRSGGRGRRCRRLRRCSRIGCRRRRDLRNGCDDLRCRCCVRQRLERGRGRNLHSSGHEHRRRVAREQPEGQHHKRHNESLRVRPHTLYG